MGRYDGMLDYIKESAAQVALDVDRREELTHSLVETYARLSPRSIWLIACGSSSNASRCAVPFMRRTLGCDVEVVNPASFLFSDHVPSDDTLCMVISQSGCSTNSIKALDRLRELGRVAIGLTGNLDGDFRDHSDLLVDYGVGEETVGYVTKGVTTLAEYLMLFSLEAARATGAIDEAAYDGSVAQFEAIPAAHEEVYRLTEEFYQTNRKGLTSILTNYVCGFDQAYGIACEAALKFGETMKIPSFAYEAEEYNHGPNLQLTPNYTVFFVDDMNRGHDRLLQLWHATSLVTDHAYLLTDADEQGDTVFHIPADHPADPLLEPLYLLPFFQTIAFRATDELGRWTDHPLMHQYKAAAPSKTETIEKVMPNL
ncbi:MAG: SIS domain-containing protein [Atopobiaceae bacterium]|nr:SIS domain-containing protein [Atopobiaceae bacterium]MCI2172659.1 SIS domain-containing protein [Atopobiaceae bacterium]MCI2206966.1 SIS domain-containing protein [Atopobiaceae bacterium]